MEFQEIEIFIDQEGQVQLKVAGVKGTTCLDLTKDLEEALGAQIETRRLTSEAYEETSQHAPNRQQQKV